MGYVNGLLHLQGQNDRVTWPGIKLNDFLPQLVLHAQDNPRKESSLVNVVDQDPFYGRFQSLQDQTDQVVSQRSFLLNLIHRHVDCVPYGRVHLDDESLFVIAQKDRATVGSRHHSLYRDFGRVIIHLVIIPLVDCVRKHL